MSRKQKKVIVASAIAIIMMMLVPPYVSKPQKGMYGSGHSGYEVLFDLDANEDVRFGVLALQIVAVTMIGGLVVWLSKEKDTQA